MLKLAVFCVSLLVAAESFNIGHIDFPICPIVDCLYQPCPSGQYKTNYMTVGGRNCPTCSTCLDTSAVAARDLVHLQMPCPIVDCLYQPCPSGQYKTNYMTIGGRKCPTCSTCLDMSAVAARDLVFQMPCPIFDCMYIQNCPSGQLKTNYVTINGRQCPSCPSCVNNAALVRAVVSAFLPCPLYECAMMLCPNGVSHPSYQIVNGQKCPTCPTCTDQSILSLRDAQDIGVCPAAMCTATDKCDKAHLEQSYFSFHGQECPGCPTCTNT